MWLGVIFELSVWNKWRSLSCALCCHLLLLPDCPEAVLSVLLAVPTWHEFCQRPGSPKSRAGWSRLVLFFQNCLYVRVLPHKQVTAHRQHCPHRGFVPSHLFVFQTERTSPRKEGELHKHLLLAAQQVAGHMAGIAKYQCLVKPLQLVRLPRRM